MSLSQEGRRIVQDTFRTGYRPWSHAETIQDNENGCTLLWKVKVNICWVRRRRMEFSERKVNGTEDEDLALVQTMKEFGFPGSTGRGAERGKDP